VAQALCSYNGHLSRIELITYDTLFEAAEGALEFEEISRTQHAQDDLLGGG
jgi:hypothetical protein